MVASGSHKHHSTNWSSSDHDFAGAELTSFNGELATEPILDGNQEIVSGLE